MTTIAAARKRQGDISNRLISAALGVKPLWSIAKYQARRMMIQRAERLGIPWTNKVKEYEQRDWSLLWDELNDPNLQYPRQLSSFFSRLRRRPPLLASRLRIRGGFQRGAFESVSRSRSSQRSSLEGGLSPGLTGSIEPAT